MLAATVLAVAALLTWIGTPEPVRETRPRVQADPPPAVAPPDPGVEPPRVLLHDQSSVPLASRPQKQLSVWAGSMSEDLDIPKAALEAYGYAARAAQATHPQCGVSWTLLAGIGSVESHHGRYGGGRLDETGRPTIPIRGLPLDGQRGVKRIDDTDRGQLDGDPTFDRAVGPLQFLPATWHVWGADADGDGTADPNDIDDAALAAANYLCTVGGDLRVPDRFWASLLIYNESHSYGQEVLDHADHYGRISRVLARTR